MRERPHCPLRSAPGREDRRPRRPRVAPNRAVIYDWWIEHDPARAELALAELRAAAAASPEAALRQAVERPLGHASEEAIRRWLTDRETERPSAPAKPRSRAAGRRWRRAVGT